MYTAVVPLFRLLCSGCSPRRPQAFLSAFFDVKFPPSVHRTSSSPAPRPPRVQMAKAFALLVAASLVLVGVAQAQSFNQYLGAKNGGTYTHSPR